MKNKFTILVLLLTGIAAAGCSRKCCELGPTSNYISLQKNGESLYLSTENATFKQDTLTMVGHAGEQALSIKIKYTGIGKYLLTGNQVRYFATTFGDHLVTDSYIDAGTESVLNVTRYDDGIRRVTGDLSLKLTKTPSFTGANNNYPEKMVATGTFSVLMDK